MSAIPPPKAAAAPRASSVVRVVWVLWIIGYLVGTTTHSADLIVSGVRIYEGFPVGVRLFWVSLTVLDPLVVVLLVLRRRAGVVLGVAVILIDIAVNWPVYATTGGTPAFVISQTLFAILLVTTAHLLWRWFTASRQ